MCTPSLLVSIGSLPPIVPENRRNRKEKETKSACCGITSTCFVRCLLSLLGRMLWCLICYFPTPCGKDDYGEQYEEARCCRCDAREEVCRTRPERIHEQAACGVSQGLSGTVAQKPYGEHASQEGVGHPLLQDGIGRNVVHAGGGSLHRQGAESEDEGGGQSRS